MEEDDSNLKEAVVGKKSISGKHSKHVFFKVVSNNMASKFFYGGLHVQNVDCMVQIYEVVDGGSSSQAFVVTPMIGAGSLLALCWFLEYPERTATFCIHMVQ